MPVIAATLVTFIIASVAFRTICLRTDPSSRRGTIIINVALAIELVILIFTVTTLSISFSVSNTPLTDDVVDVYLSLAGGYRESKVDVDDETSLQGAILLYYKPGCPDCTAIWDELTNAVAEADKPDVYFINTKSPTGRKLLERYPVEDVPSGVYVARAENNTDSFREKLFMTTKNGTHFRWEALDFLLRCQAQRW